MCKPSSPPMRVLLSKQSLSLSKDHGPLDMPSVSLTVAIVVLVLFALEHLVARPALENMKDLHPILEIEMNRFVIARHIGVSFVSCVAVSIVGLLGRHHMSDLLESFFSFGKKNTMVLNREGFERRLFEFRQEGSLVLLLFLGYQMKNLYDSYVWDDGPEFIFHHVLAATAAFGGLNPGCSQYYAIFYMGISEISTGVLVLLANFDPDLGVQGLEDVLPITRVIIGLVFVVAFIICRTLLWPFTTYYFVNDVFNAVASDSILAKQHKKWLYIQVGTCAGLSVLQVLWLGQIFYTVYIEAAKLLG